MSIAETFILALKNIVSSKMRTFLTMLGIIIGVCAVIIIIGLGNGMTEYMEDSFASMGTNTLTVMIGGRGSTRSISVDDMYKIVEENQEYLDAVSPTVSMRGGIKVGTESYSGTSVSGVGEDYFRMKGYEVSKGRGLTYMDIKERKNVCVVGNYVSEEYYGGNPIGEVIKVGPNKFTIVGVLAQEVDEMEEGGTDDYVYVPYSLAARLSSMGTINNFTVTIQNEETATISKQIVEKALFDIFNDSDAYTVISMSEILDIMNSMLNIVINVLAIIAGISLLVGGIGIMNIMLVSVTERTREIGIRKALGAKEGSILQQFVIEAATTSALGGIIGIGLGYIFSSIASSVIQVVLDAPLKVTPTAFSIMIAFSVSVGIGILFGFLPARKAARLNPIDALRYD
jgi:putative ABC transport system permease protein